jgi:hypothetical protein
MIEDNHQLNSGSRERVTARLILIELDVLGIPEAEKIDDPFVVCSLPRDEAVPFAICPVAIQDRRQSIHDAERVTQ